MARNKLTGIRKIIWAVDPFAKDTQLQASTVSTIRALTRRQSGPIEIEPVYCLELSALEAPLDYSSGLIDDIKESARKGLGRILGRTQLSGLKPLTILVEPGVSLRGAVEALVSHAHKRGADLIVASTHARKGMARWMMGSFAETLSFRSDLPLLVINPRWKGPTDFKNILFPTDFSDESRQAFEQVLSFARALGSRITLFHKVKYDLTPGAEVAFMAYSAYQEVFDQDVASRNAEAESWAQEGRKIGVSINVLVDRRLAGSASEAILKLAGNRYGMIAMAAHSGVFARAFLGSTARQVIRAATCPVWVFHPKAQAASARKRA